jgi:hypothetical protein
VAVVIGVGLCGVVWGCFGTKQKATETIAKNNNTERVRGSGHIVCQRVLLCGAI